MVFHRFMQGAVSGRRKLDIYVCGERLLPWDPFCRTESTQELDIIKIPVISIEPDGSKLKGNITVSPFVLPREDEFSSQSAWRDASGPKNWNQQQGIYFYRNNRLLQAGGWSYLRAVDEHTKLLRVAIDFPGDLDRAFSINVTKMRARIPAEIRERLNSHIGGWAKKARVRYDRKIFKRHVLVSGNQESAADIKNNRTSNVVSDVNLGPLIFSKNNKPGHSLVITANKKTGQIEILVPQSHDLSQIFTLKGSGNAELQKLCLAMLSILEAVHDKKIKIDQIPVSAIKKVFKSIL